MNRVCSNCRIVRQVGYGGDIAPRKVPRLVFRQPPPVKCNPY